MRYMKKYPTREDVKEAVENNLLGKPYVAYIEDEQVIDWDGYKPEPVYSATPLTFEVISAGTILWRAQSTASTRTIEYSLNDGPWTTFTSTTAGTVLNVVAGDKVSFRGTNATYGTVDNASRFSNSTCYFNLYGNILSLINKDNYMNMTGITAGQNNFWAMFYSTRVVDASNLWLPDTLTKGAFYYFFKSCPYLEKAPVLGHSYAALKAVNAYYYMFEGCSKLTYVKCLFDRANSNSSNFTGWLKGVAAAGTFVKHPNASWSRGMSAIPNGWTIETATE